MLKGQYIPLADVPDFAWKTPQRKPLEAPNHFIEIDRYCIPLGLTIAQLTTLSRVWKNGKNMIEMMKIDPSVVTDVSKWLHYYDGAAPTDMGLLHFRVWQLYDLLVGYIKVCALNPIHSISNN